MPALASITAAPRFLSSGAPANAKSANPAHAGLGFADLLDTINPLQHIPIIGSIYRAITGDQMSPTAEIAGGALFGGIVGAVTSIADVVFTQATGKRFGEGLSDRVLAWLGIGGNNSSGTQFASAKASSALPNVQPAAAIDSAIAARTAIAYRTALTLKDPAPEQALSLTY